MNVSSITAHAAAQAASNRLATNRAAGPGAVPTSTSALSGFGSLSSQQLKTLRAAVGYDFNWPPSHNDLFPWAALELSQQNGSGWIAAQKDLTAAGLNKLAAAGLLSAADVARGTAYLQQGSATAVARQGAARRPVSGTVAADGSVYL
jgi:hypothetical protein